MPENDVPDPPSTEPPPQGKPDLNDGTAYLDKEEDENYSEPSEDNPES